MWKPDTIKEIEGLVHHIVATCETKNERLLKAIYWDLGMTAGNIFRLKLEKIAGVDLKV